MADYHPLIARAVAGLEKNTGENRRALYERARIALVAQFRGVAPALDESEITRERLALEEAIRKVEAEAARNARETARPNIDPARRVAAHGADAPRTPIRRVTLSSTPSRQFAGTVASPRRGAPPAPPPQPRPAVSSRRTLAGRGAERIPRQSRPVARSPTARAAAARETPPRPRRRRDRPARRRAPSPQPPPPHAGAPSARGVRPARAADAAGKPAGRCRSTARKPRRRSISMRINRRCSAQAARRGRTNIRRRSGRRGRTAR